VDHRPGRRAVAPRDLDAQMSEIRDIGPTEVRAVNHRGAFEGEQWTSSHFSRVLERSKGWGCTYEHLTL